MTKAFIRNFIRHTVVWSMLTVALVAPTMWHQTHWDVDPNMHKHVHPQEWK